jgi:hypothetical protein
MALTSQGLDAVEKRHNVRKEPDAQTTRPALKSIGMSFSQP